MKHLKCVAVGNSLSEKTRMLINFTTNSYTDDEYTPTVFDNYSANVMVDEKPINFQLWDTSGQEDYVKLRPLSYPQTDIFIIVFSLVHPETLQEVEDLWVPEVREHCPGTPYILVGTHVNERDNFNQHAEEYESKGWSPVSKSEGEDMKSKILAVYYFECDLKSKSSLENLFLKAAITGLKGGAPQNADLYKIFLYGKNKESKTKIALNYILGDFHKGKLPVDESEFYKVEDVNDVIYKITVDITNSENLKDACALLFIYDAGDENLDDLKSLFKKIISNEIKLPYAFAVNIDSQKEGITNSDESIDELNRYFKCDVFKITDYSKEDIEEVFFYLNQRISERIKYLNKRETKNLSKITSFKSHSKKKERRKFFKSTKNDI